MIEFIDANELYDDAVSMSVHTGENNIVAVDDNMVYEYDFIHVLNDDATSVVTRTVSHPKKINVFDTMLSFVPETTDDDGNVTPAAVYARVNINLEENGLVYNNVNERNYYYDDVSHQILDFITVKLTNNSQSVGGNDVSFETYIHVARQPTDNDVNDSDSALDAQDEQTRRNITSAVLSLTGAEAVDGENYSVTVTGNYVVNNQLYVGSINTASGSERLRLLGVMEIDTNAGNEQESHSHTSTAETLTNIDDLKELEFVVDLDMDQSSDSTAVPRYTIKMPSQPKDEDNTDGVTSNSVVMKLYIGEKDTGVAADADVDNGAFLYINNEERTETFDFEHQEKTITQSKVVFNESSLSGYATFGTDKMGVLNGGNMMSNGRSEKYNMFFNVKHTKTNGTTDSVDSVNESLVLHNVKPNIEYEYIRQTHAGAELVPNHTLNTAPGITLNDIEVTIEMKDDNDNVIRSVTTKASKPVVFPWIESDNTDNADGLTGKTLHYTAKYVALNGTRNITYTVSNMQQQFGSPSSLNIAPLMVNNLPITVLNTNDTAAVITVSLPSSNPNIPSFDPATGAGVNVTLAHLIRLNSANSVGNSALNMTSNDEVNGALRDNEDRRGRYALTGTTDSDAFFSYILNFTD